MTAGTRIRYMGNKQQLAGDVAMFCETLDPDRRLVDLFGGMGWSPAPLPPAVATSGPTIYSSTRSSRLDVLSPAQKTRRLSTLPDIYSCLVIAPTSPRSANATPPSCGPSSASSGQGTRPSFVAFRLNGAMLRTTVTSPPK